MTGPQIAVRRKAIALMKNAMAQVAEQGDRIIPRTEAQVHQAIDLLRTSNADGELLGIAEFVSCRLIEMRHYQHQGRVNAYASKLVRVKKACRALS